MSTRPNLSRRELLRWSSIAAMAGVAAACSSAPTATPQPVATLAVEATSVPSSESQATPAARTFGKLRFLERHSEAFGHVWTKAIDVFNQKYPNVQVERIQPPGTEDHNAKLLTMAAGGDAPDAFWTTWDWVSMQRQGIFRNLTPFMEKEDFDPYAVYEAGWIDMWRQKDGHYGLPWDAFIFMLFYNKDLFDRKDLDYPPRDKPLTWQQVLETGQKITEWDGNRPVTLGANVYIGGWGMWWIWLSQAGLDLYDTDMTKVNLDQPETWQVIDSFAEWSWKHKVETFSAQGADVPVGFPSGILGMAIMAVCQWAWVRDQCKFPWDVSPFPQMSADAKPQVLGWVCPVVTCQEGPNPDAAWEFVKAVCGPEAYVELYKAGMSMPTLKVHTDPVHPEFLASKPPENNTHVIEYARYLKTPVPWNNGAWNSVLRIVNEGIDQVFLGKMTAKEAMMEHVVPQANKVLKDLRDAGTL